MQREKDLHTLISTPSPNIVIEFKLIIILSRSIMKLANTIGNLIWRKYFSFSSSYPFTNEPATLSSNEQESKKGIQSTSKGHESSRVHFTQYPQETDFIMAVIFSNCPMGVLLILVGDFIVALCSAFSPWRLVGFYVSLSTSIAQHRQWGCQH